MRLDTPTRMQQALSFIHHFVKENQYAPSLREIGDGIGLKSAAHVRDLLYLLQDEGKIVLVPGQPRTIRVSE